MLSLLSLGFAALIASTKSMALTPIADLSRPDPCLLADIAWDGSTGPFNFDAGERTNITTRTHNYRQFWTREEVIVEAGSSDDIVVEYDIKLSTDELQDAVYIVTEDNDIALIIDGSRIEPEPSAPQCVVATTLVKLPKKLHHLVFDVDNSVTRFKSISSTFDTLDLHGKNGGFSFTESDPTISELHADLLNGGYSFVSSHPTITLLDVQLKNGAFNTKDDSVITAERATIKSNNGPIIARLKGAASLEVTSSNGYIDLDLLDDDGSKTPTITTSSAHGRVQIKSHIKRAIDVKTTSQTGSVSVEIVDNEGGSFHAQTKIGRPTINGDVKITKTKKTLTGLELEGTFGDRAGSDGGSTIDLDVSVGSINLLVRTESDDSFLPIVGDGGNKKPHGHGGKEVEGEDHGRWDAHEPRHRGFMHPHFVWVLLIIVFSVVAWQKRKRSQARGYQGIVEVENKN